MIDIEDIIHYVILMIMLLCLLVLPMLFIGIIYSDSVELKIINEEYGTNYTLWEYFFAEETIKENIVGYQNNIKLEKQ